MAERGSDQEGASEKQTPFEKARANPAVRESMLRALDAKLRGEKPVPAVELMEGLKDDEARRNGGGR